MVRLRPAPKRQRKFSAVADQSPRMSALGVGIAVVAPPSSKATIRQETSVNQLLTSYVIDRLSRLQCVLCQRVRKRGDAAE